MKQSISVACLFTKLQYNNKCHIVIYYNIIQQSVCLFRIDYSIINKFINYVLSQ